MTVVRPFRALRYDPTKVDLSNVIVPPYDVIANDEREGFFERDPHNAIRLELTRKADDEAGADYSDVADTLASWRAASVMARDDAPGFYVMRQRYKAPDGQLLEREGFFAELGLESYDARVVLPHERTLAGPKADRLKMLRATKANLSSVFMLYEDREQELAGLMRAALEAAEASVTARDDAGVEYQVAALRDPAAIAKIQAFLAARPVVIADGHHRYETALAYRDEQRQAHPDAGPEAAFESTQVYLANAYAPGSLLLPIHRVVLGAAMPPAQQWAEQLAGWQRKDIPVRPGQEMAALLEEHLAPLAGKPAFAAEDATGALSVFHREEPLGEDLMVRVIERDVLGRVFGLSPDAVRDGAVSFPKSAERAAREVRDGQGVALYLNPLSPDDVFRVTGAGDVMPQKSTFFYPKIPTGFVFRVHKDDA